MIKIDTIDLVGLRPAIISMRNALNSWDKSDSEEDGLNQFWIGEDDMKLAMKLVNAGPSHCKFRRMINVYVNITAPFYWWKQFDTYKVGTVCNSCSTMHTIHKAPFERTMFSCESIDGKTFGANTMYVLDGMIGHLNLLRDLYLETGEKDYWTQMIQLLPESFNQMRTVMVNYETLANIYHTRRNHKLDEWHDFCDWIEGLRYSELIIGE